MTKNTIDIEKIREKILLSPETVWGITSLEKQVGKTFISKILVEKMLDIDKNTLYLSIGKNENILFDYEIKNLDDAIGTIENKKEKHWISIDTTDNVANLVFDDRFKKLLEICKENYDYVIVDMEAIKESGVSKKVCSLCENNIIVISKGREDGVSVRKEINELQTMNIKIAGIILNGHKIRKSLLRM